MSKFILLWEWTWPHTASLNARQRFNCDFFSRAHIFPRIDNGARVSVLPNIRYAVTSHPCWKRDKVYITLRFQWDISRTIVTSVQYGFAQLSILKLMIQVPSIILVLSKSSKIEITCICTTVHLIGHWRADSWKITCTRLCFTSRMDTMPLKFKQQYQFAEKVCEKLLKKKKEKKKNIGNNWVQIALVMVSHPFYIEVGWKFTRGNFYDSRLITNSYLPTVQFLEGLSSFLWFQILKNWTVQFFFEVLVMWNSTVRTTK